MNPCPHCGAANREGAKFCAGCGTRLAAPSSPPPAASERVMCLSCGALNESTVQYCESCGAALELLAAAPPPPPAAAAATVADDGVHCGGCGQIVRFCPYCGRPWSEH